MSVYTMYNYNMYFVQYKIYNRDRLYLRLNQANLYPGKTCGSRKFFEKSNF